VYYFENYELILRKTCPSEKDPGADTILNKEFCSLFVILFVNCILLFNPEMPTIHTEYTGELRTRAKHIKSGMELITDAPEDNKGRGEAFSPTDLLATALGSCMITIAGMTAQEHGFSIDGTTIDITKIMASDPRRVAEVVVELHFPKNNFTGRQKDLIRQACLNCPVANSVHPDLKKTVVFNF
jgi:putative redox protein